MNKRLITSILLLATVVSARAQQQEGKKNIEKLCGCFDVDFRYAETFAPDTTYKFHDREHSHATAELALPIAVSNNKIIIQHLLVINDTMIVKHWREDWEYQANDILVYQGNKQWTKQAIPAEETKGKWTQTVWEVDDAPRYQGTSSWITANGKTYWENTTNAPLPRREYSTRNDYQILKRGNRIALNAAGYLHEQDNDKIIKEGNAEKLLVQEKGLNAYVKLPDSKCAAAKAWWDKNGAFWTVIRTQWDAVVKAQSAINLKNKVESKRLDEYFGSLQKQWNAKTITLDEAGKQAKTVIEKFVGADKDVAVK